MMKYLLLLGFKYPPNKYFPKFLEISLRLREKKESQNTFGAWWFLQRLPSTCQRLVRSDKCFQCGSAGILFLVFLGFVFFFFKDFE